MIKIFSAVGLILVAVIIGMAFFISSIRKQLNEVREINTRMEIQQESAIGHLEIIQRNRAIEDSLRLLPSDKYEKEIEIIHNATADELKRFIMESSR